MISWAGRGQHHDDARIEIEGDRGGYIDVRVRNPGLAPGWHRVTVQSAGSEPVECDVQIIGDDVLVTNATRVERAVAGHVCNAALIKVNQVGTVTEAKAALDAARAAGWGTIVSARSGETEDVTIAHLSTGWNAGQLKVGSFTRSERMAKWNEVLRIEEELGDGAVFAGSSAFAAPVAAALNGVP